ncbi:MAG: type II secretion system F family protein [Bdellovibrionales bacterium]|nr:type II secretion system F family protein [Bdellovibrionales bacterium]
MFLVAGIVFALSYLWSDKIIAFLHSKSLGSREYVLNRIRNDLMDPSQYESFSEKKLTITMLLLSFGLGALFFLLLYPNVILGMIVGSIFTMIGWSAPKLIVDYLFNKRVNIFADQMVDGMIIMANGINSGLTVQQSMQRVVDNMTGPIAQEYQKVLNKLKVGGTLEDALNEMGDRLPAPDVQMFVTSVNILNQTGKGLATTFTTIMETIRERQKITKKIEALTAQGIMQGIIISCVPFILMAIFLAIDPGFIKPLFNSTLGVIFLLIMLTLQVIGGLVIRKIVNIKV